MSCVCCVPACQLLDIAHATNCSHEGGVWQNHTCLTVDVNTSVVNVSAPEPTQEIVKSKSPADEFFQ